MKRFINLTLCVLLLLAVALPASASSIRVVDESNLITSSEEAVLLQEANRLAQTYQMDVVLVTTDYLNGQSATAFADDFFDYGGYGLNSSRDGILLLVSVGAGDWALSTRGAGITTFSAQTCDYMAQQFLPYLSNGDYMNAFRLYFSQVEAYLSGSAAPVAQSSANVGFKVLLTIGLALLIAFVVTMALKAQLNNAKPQRLAHSYLSDFRLYQQSDVFLYSNVTRIKIPENNGGGTHIGSSGGSHGGSSGKF